MPMQLTRHAESLARRLIRDPGFRLDPDLGALALSEAMLRRLLALGRGALRAPYLGASTLPLFIGARVEIRHRRSLRLGRYVVLEDDVHIDALSRRGVTLGSNVCIARFATIEASAALTALGEGIVLGDNCIVGDYSFIGGGAPIVIGDNVMIGQRVSFHPENHVFASTDLPIRLQGVTREGITVGADCWLGAGVIVLDGVTIGQGSVIAAGAVVTHSLPPHCVAAGVPARVLRSRLPPGDLSVSDPGACSCSAAL